MLEVLLLSGFRVCVTDLFPKNNLSDVHHLTDLVVKASTLRAEEPGFNSRLRCGDFSGSSHTRDMRIGTPVAILPGARRYAYRVSTGTGWPGVSIP